MKARTHPVGIKADSCSPRIPHASRFSWKMTFQAVIPAIQIVAPMIESITYLEKNSSFYERQKSAKNSQIRRNMSILRNMSTPRKMAIARKLSTARKIKFFETYRLIIFCSSKGSLKNASLKNQIPLMNQSHGSSAKPMKKFFLQTASFSPPDFRVKSISRNATVSPSGVNELYFGSWQTSGITILIQY